MKILMEVEDRIRKDSTCVYFYNAFSKLADVVKAYPEELAYIDSKKFDLYVRVDYGIDNRIWREDFHPSVYYAIDTHIDPAWRLAMAKEAQFDYVFCAQKDGADLSWHTDKVQFLPLACEPESHSVQGGISKRYDVCFIGNTQVNWQARRVERLDKLFKAIPNFYYGNKFFLEMALKFTESKLVFNSQYSNDINMRVFEAMCSGSALLTEKLDWQGMFEDDKHLISYSNDDEMLDKAKYYIAHEEEREKIAELGKKEVLSKHTYLDRAKKILAVTGGIK